MRGPDSTSSDSALSRQHRNDAGLPGASWRVLTTDRAGSAYAPAMHFRMTGRRHAFHGPDGNVDPTPSAPATPPRVERPASPFRLSLWGATLLQVGADVAGAFLSVIAIFSLHNQAITGSTVLVGAGFAALVVALIGAFAIYRHDQNISFGSYASRLFLALAIAGPIGYVLAAFLHDGEWLRHVLPDSFALAFASLLAIRHVLVKPLLKSLVPHRVLVLGTGPEARVVGATLSAADPPGMRLVGFFALDKDQANVVAPGFVVAHGEALDETVKKLGIDEVIVAVRQQRGGVLPLRALLNCRLAGVRITDMARFFERVQGQIPVDLLKASWLIYGNGFRQGWLRTHVKRAFDIVVCASLLLFTLPIWLVTAVLILLESGAPVIYRQERVGLRGRTFHVLKFRSMRQDAEKDGKATWATVGDARITRLGRLLRRSRIDELPQLINVLKGDMSFVGPRPERPVFVEMLTREVPFYAMRHSVKPGITGWAQVRYSYGASVEQAVKKLEYDLYYVKNNTLVLDLLILLETVRVVLLGEGAR
jgi:sugar transferase (PEP-CTERM system associated)